MAKQPYAKPPGKGMGAIADPIQELNRRVKEVESPTAETLTNMLQQVKDALVNLTAQVNSLVAAALGNYYTASQVLVVVASPGNISPANVTAGGNVSAAGQVSGASGVFNGGLYSTDAYSFNMTGTRVSGWHQIDGHIGTASSSERFKTNIVDAKLYEKAEEILAIVWVYYNYKLEIAKRDDPTSDGYVGPTYQVHQELGAIAERLHEAGLWEFVVYERDAVTETRIRDVVDIEGNTTQEEYTCYLGDTLRLDADGNPIPFGIHYDMLGMAGIAVSQYLKQQADQRYQETSDRLAAIEDHLGLSNNG